MFRIITAAVVGIDAARIEVEADITPGIPHVSIVGLPDAAVTEAHERVRSAIMNTPGVHFPLRRITVNLAPADLRKEGSGFDLPIAVAILGASGEIPNLPAEVCFLGELSLDGTLRPTVGVLPIVSQLRDQGVRRFVVPQENAAEAALISGVTIFSAPTLRAVVRHFRGRAIIPPYVPSESAVPSDSVGVDFVEIAGQEQAKRCLEIAAAGGHNLLFSGPPGSGKTLLARSFEGILPPLNENEAIEVTRIFSVAGLLNRDEPLISQRPFRSPHHTSSAAAIVGGGTNPRPGEISLAHRGVLFLDEFPEFPRTVLEALRQPLEDGYVTVSRARSSVKFPARFSLIASQNPCPCGYFGDAGVVCRCSPIQIERYRRRLSGPLLDRIDVFCPVPRLESRELRRIGTGTSADARQRVLAAREQQDQRFAESRTITNSEMTLTELRAACRLDDQATAMLDLAARQLRLSGRAIHRVLRVSRTIADLAADDAIAPGHLAEALQYRSRVT